MNIPFSPPDITEEEIEAVAEVMRSGWITTGPKTKELERKMAEFTHTNRGVCLNSATSCMEMALRLFEIGPGDEVLCRHIHTLPVPVLYVMLVRHCVLWM